jgi:serine/threonine protein phosphatase PrpC
MADYPDSNIIVSSLTKAFEETNNEVYKMVSDVRFSGSTCTSIITYGRKVFCANVGDSRTILIRQNPQGEGCLVRSLSRDHKPDDPEESKVILANNGRIDSYRDQLGNQIGPMRVWLKNEDIPGLAMSRSFGDAMAARVGVNAVPEIKEFFLQPEDKVMVLASDGVWEFLKNQEVANIVFPFFL